MALLFDLLRSAVITGFVSSPAAYFRGNVFFHGTAIINQTEIRRVKINTRK
jgi:hypothetical protein